MSGGGGGAVRAVKSRGGGAVAQWRKRACEWEGVLLARRLMRMTMHHHNRYDPATGCCSANLHQTSKLASRADAGENGPTLARCFSL